MAEASNKGVGGWIVAGIVAAALAGGAVFLQREEQTPETPDDTLGFFNPAKAVESARIVIECEKPSTLSDGLPIKIVALADADVDTHPGRTERLTQASGGAALYVGPEKFNDNWKGKLKTGEVEREPAQFGHADADAPGFARYTFRVPEDAAYEIWLRAFWVDDCGNSVDLALNDGPLMNITDSNVGRWTWRRLDTAERTARLFPLEAGRDHTLTLCNREDDCYLDQILIRRHGDGAADPVGPQRAD